jgi:multidrug transporter EmrE-like cation transporter
MVYPAAIGICVVLFYIYSVVFLKEEFKGRTIASVSGITAGIFLLAL